MPNTGVTGPARALVRVWLMSKTAELEAVPRPVNSADQRLPGPDPLAVLVVGGGAASGWGVRSHELGFTGALARRLRHATGRGVKLKSRIGPDLTSADAAEAVRAARTRFDELRFVVLGVSETLNMLRPAQWRADMERIVEALGPSPDHPAVLVGVQPISSIPVYHGGFSHWLDRHAQALNDETRALCAATPHTAFAPLPAPPTVRLARYRGPADYDFWATEVTAVAMPLLPDPTERTAPAPDDSAAERRRQAELARLGIDGERTHLAVDSLVRFTRAVFDMQSAEMLILGVDRAFSMSSTSPERPQEERGRSFTAYAIESRGCFIVPDASEDPRFQEHSGVTGGPGLRFFAAHPVAGPSGERIGVLAVYDRVPREFDDTSQHLLQALAGQMEQVLREQL